MTNSINPNSLTGLQRGLAKILHSKFGSCEFVHYALRCQNGQVLNLQEQQKEFANKIVDCVKVSLGPNPSILLHGPSLQYVAKRLSSPDHNVEWLDSAHERTCGKQESDTSYLHDLLVKDYQEPNRFQVMVVEGSYPYLEQLNLLQKCKELMVDGGSLIIFGEYLDDDSQRQYSVLPNLSSLRQLSERLGLELLTETDYTDDAISTIHAFLDILTEGAADNFKAEDRAEIIQSLGEIQSEFEIKRRCYKVFRFMKVIKDSGDYAAAHYGNVESFHPKEISQLFEKSFETIFDEEIWRWKYEMGNGKCVVARSKKDGAVVSHYGGAPRKIQYFGEPNTAIQVCDVMVLPEVRLHYGKNSLFFKTAATFLEREIGNTVGHLLGFGFPNRKAMNIALRLGLYEKTDDFVEMICPSAPDQAVSKYKFVNIEEDNAEHQAAVDRLWDSMKLSFSAGVIGNRDWNYIKYRYFDHPYGKSGKFKRVFLANEMEEICAACFIKEHEQRNLLMDIICPIKDIAQQVMNLNILLDESELKIWITEGWSETLKITGMIENKLGIEIPCNQWNPGPSSQVLYGAWWLMAGDMDFM